MSNGSFNIYKLRIKIIIIFSIKLYAKLFNRSVGIMHKLTKHHMATVNVEA